MVNVKHKHEFLQVVRREDNQPVAVTLPSNRDIAFSHRSMDTTLMCGLLSKRQYSWALHGLLSSTNLNLETSAASKDSSVRTFIYTPNFDTVGETTDIEILGKSNTNILHLSGTFDLAFSAAEVNDTPDNISNFTDYNGPATTLYLNSQDVLVNYLLDDTAGSSINFTFTDLNPDAFNGVGDRIYPPQFPIWVAIVITDSNEYTPLLGKSQLVSYTADKQQRKIQWVIHPSLAKSTSEKISYPVKDPAELSPDLRRDEFAFNYAYQDPYLGTAYDAFEYTTQSSIFGRVLDRISYINSNYTLPQELGVKYILSLDLWRFFKAYEIINFIQELPLEIKTNFMKGTLPSPYNIKIKHATKHDTFLTADDLEALWKIPPTLSYFSNKLLN